MNTKARRAKDLRLRREFHITLDQHDTVLGSQLKACAICGNIFNKKGAPLQLAVDHDHKTGQVRGLLCWPCNKAIAILQDNAQRCYNAYKYLSLPPFERIYGKIFTAPGEVGTKKRKKQLAAFNAAREKDGEKAQLQTRTRSKKQKSI